MNIWQIQQDLLDVFNELEENGGELTEELESKLTITQEQFKDKIESYTNVIKSIKADITAIDQETKRLNEFKKSKETIINRLNNVIIDAVDKFGESTKTGGKFIDYGTGKVSVRNSVKCETDDDKLDCIADEYGKTIAFELMLGGANTRNNITFEEMIEKCNSHKVVTEDGEVIDSPYNISKEDIETSTFNITVKVGLEDMLCGDGYRSILKLCDTFDVNPVITPKIDKTLLKCYLTRNENNNVTIGQLTQNKTIQIK